MGECSSLAEKHNRDLVPFFLSLAGPNATAKMPRRKLGSWLKLFARFSNPKALHSTETLHSLYVSLLSHADRATQTLSLSCLFTYKSPHLSTHENQLRALLDDARWREELTSLDLTEVEPKDRNEVVNVIIRLLFGLMVEKKGRSRGVDRRVAVLTTLAGCTDRELGLLVELMLQSDSPESQASLNRPSEGTSGRQQIGFLTLLGDVVRNLGPRLVSYWPSLLETIINFTGNAQARVEAANVLDGHVEGEEVQADEFEEPEDEEKGISLKLSRSVRQLGVKRFTDFFKCPVAFEFAPYVKEAFKSFISPRVSFLNVENTQAPSTLLELFYTWTSRAEHVKFLVAFDNRVLPKIYDCLVATNVKPAVVSRIFDIVDRLLAFSTADTVISETVIKPHISLLLENLATLVERTKGIAAVSTPLIQRQISILSEIAQYSSDPSQASMLLNLFIPLLQKQHKLVPEKVKINLLKILYNLLPLLPDMVDRSSTIYVKTYKILSQLFQSLRGRPARLILVSTFHCLARIDASLQPLADLLDALNSYSSKRLEEPDFDRRLEAFTSLNESLCRSFSPSHWLPLIFCALYFIQDPDELAIRNNAALSLRTFVDQVAANPSSEYEVTFMKTLYPGLKNGLHSKNEMVRAEVLGVLAFSVTKCNAISSLQEMQSLLADGDEEANFFNNIHHIQIHRRTRALRRLADICDEGHLRSNTLAEIFIPLVGNFIMSPSSLDHHLVNEAITTTGRMAKHLSWGAYYALVQRYLKASREKDESERVYVRTLVAILQNFHFPMEDIAQDFERQEPEDNSIDHIGNTTPPTNVSKGVDVGRIADAVNSNLLPSLLKHLEKRDETEDSIRIPISIGIVEVAKHLPEALREVQISRLLTVLSQIFRSKSQETRDLTRDALCRIAIILGPDYLPHILREMRAALLRGPQLHVLAYVTHALLVHVTTAEHANTFHTLDNCVHDVAHISAEVIFGESGKDVQAEDFKTKMREVRASFSKGLDSFAIIAKFVTPSRISGLLIPLRAIMQETASVKVMSVMEDLLRRIASGLNANKHLVPTELLALCNTLISQNARFLQVAPKPTERKAKGDVIVQMKRQVVTETNHFANNSFR
jgi:U3 small nucleolar RNA-associated protein 20